MLQVPSHPAGHRKRAELEAMFEEVAGIERKGQRDGHVKQGRKRKKTISRKEANRANNDEALQPAIQRPGEDDGRKRQEQPDRAIYRPACRPANSGHTAWPRPVAPATCRPAVRGPDLLLGSVSANSQSLVCSSMPCWRISRFRRKLQTLLYRVEQ